MVFSFDFHSNDLTKNGGLFVSSFLEGFLDRSVVYNKHWKAEYQAITQELPNLGPADFRLYGDMLKWYHDVGEILAYITDVLTPHGFDEILRTTSLSCARCYRGIAESLYGKWQWKGVGSWGELRLRHLLQYCGCTTAKFQLKRLLALSKDTTLDSPRQITDCRTHQGSIYDPGC